MYDHYPLILCTLLFNCNVLTYYKLTMFPCMIGIDCKQIIGNWYLFHLNEHYKFTYFFRIKFSQLSYSLHHDGIEFCLIFIFSEKAWPMNCLYRIVWILMVNQSFWKKKSESIFWTHWYFWTSMFYSFRSQYSILRISRSHFKLKLSQKYKLNFLQNSHGLRKMS